MAIYQTYKKKNQVQGEKIRSVVQILEWLPKSVKTVLLENGWFKRKPGDWTKIALTRSILIKWPQIFDIWKVRAMCDGTSKLEPFFYFKDHILV